MSAPPKDARRRRNRGPAGKRTAKKTRAASGSRGGGAQERDAGAPLWVFGPARIEETLERIPRQVRRVLVRTGRLERRHQVLVQIARARGVPVQRVPNQDLDRRAAGGRHQGAAAEVSPVRWLTLGEVLEADPPPRLLLLADRVEDPRNFGALVRAADGAGVDAVLVPRRGAAPPSPAAVAASAGAIARVRLARVPGAAAALRALREAGFRTVGLTPRAATPWHAFDWTRAAVLVVGSEGRGLGAGVSKECDTLVSLPQLGAARSLNVSVAAGIVLYEAVRQRGAGSPPAAAAPPAARPDGNRT